MVKESGTKISKPTLVVDTEKFINNITRFKSKLDDATIIRPHFKTHDNVSAGKIIREKTGIDKITVSSFDMAKKFAESGYSDITIAFPFNILEADEIFILADKVKLNICVSNFESAVFLKDFSTSKNIYIYIEIDTGYNRSGILWNDLEQLSKVLKIIDSCGYLKFVGFLTHNGSTYKKNSISEIKKSTEITNSKLIELKEFFSDYNPIISIGDTPGVITMTDFSGIDEVRPGNFVYFDLMQLNLGVCSVEDISALVYCPVVDINYDRNQVVIYGGAVHFSKEHVFYKGLNVYGKVLAIKDKMEIKSDSYLISLSQEHGIVDFSADDIKNIRIGDILVIIPVHSCLTANLLSNNTVFI